MIKNKRQNSMENEENKQDVIVPEDENLENDELDNLPEADDDIPTLEDYQKAMKQIATLKAQKEHYKKKAQAVNQPKQEPVIKKEAEVKQEQPDIEEVLDIRFLQRDGVSEEDINRLKLIRDGYKSQGKIISLVEAQNDELFKMYKQTKEEEVKKSQAQLRASNGGSYNNTKPMTPEEFESFRAKKSKELLQTMYPGM